MTKGDQNFIMEESLMKKTLKITWWCLYIQDLLWFYSFLVPTIAQVGWEGVEL